MSGNVKTAPGELELIQALVNTHDVGDATDDISEPEDLSRWLSERALIGDGEALTRADVRQAAEVREAIRQLLHANNGAPLDPAAVETLNTAAKSAELAVRFSGEGAGALAPVRSGFDGALARLLAIVFGAMADGTWSRLKACAAHDCDWAFYDASKNHSGTWCDMAVCGNREKARAYRLRRRTA